MNTNTSARRRSSSAVAPMQEPVITIPDCMMLNGDSSHKDNEPIIPSLSPPPTPPPKVYKFIFVNTHYSPNKIMR